jgi:hypothetical protein
LSRSGLGPDEDDESIVDDSILYRRLPPDQLLDREDGPGKRAATNAFNDRRDSEGVSIYLRDVMHDLGLEVKDVVNGYGPGWGVAAVTAGHVRLQGMGIVRDADPPDTGPHPCNPAHAFIKGLQPAKAGKRQSKALAQAATIYVF